MIDGFGHCEVCSGWGGGSHYHCGRCMDPEPTSMLGHNVKFADGERGFTCDEANLGRELSFFGLRVRPDQIRPAAKEEIDG